MDHMMLQKIMESEMVEKFWSELDQESIHSVEFIDAALCFAMIRELSHDHGKSVVSQA